MSRTAVCTDSSALLADAEADRLGVGVVAVGVALDGAPFDERISGIDAFYERLGAGAQTTTSQPSPGELLAAYEGLQAAGVLEILSIHLDRRLSGTAGAAEIAGRQAPVPVTVVDVETASFGVALCVREAVATLARGAGASAAAAAARELGSRLRNVFVAPTGAGGRVPHGRSWSVLELTGDGTAVRASCEKLEDAVTSMAELVIDDAATHAAVGHAAAQVGPPADELARRLVAGGVDVERYRVGAAVGAHTGPLSLGAFWWRARARPGRPGDAR